MKIRTIAERLLAVAVLCAAPIGFALWASAHPLDANWASLGWLLFGCSNAVLLAFAAKGPRRYRIRRGGGYRRRAAANRRPTGPAGGKKRETGRNLSAFVYLN